MWHMDLSDAVLRVHSCRVKSGGRGAACQRGSRTAGGSPCGGGKRAKPERRRRHVRQQNRKQPAKRAEKSGGEKIRRGLQCGKQLRKQSRGSSSGGPAQGSGSGSSAGQSAQTASSNGQAVVDYARQFLGKPLCIRRQQPDKRNRLLRICQGRVCGHLESICRAHRRNSGVWDMPSACRKSSRATLSAIAATSASMRAITH